MYLGANTDKGGEQVLMVPIVPLINGNFSSSETKSHWFRKEIILSFNKADKTKRLVQPS